jgi:hypothetical protein
MNWNKLSDIGGFMKKKKRIKENDISLLRELLQQVMSQKKSSQILPKSYKWWRVVLLSIDRLLIAVFSIMIYTFIRLSSIFIGTDLEQLYLMLLVLALPGVSVAILVLLAFYFLFREKRRVLYNREVGQLLELTNEEIGLDMTEYPTELSEEKKELGEFSDELHVRKHLEDEEISAEVRSLRNLVENFRVEYDIEEFIR